MTRKEYNKARKALQWWMMDEGIDPQREDIGWYNDHEVPDGIVWKFETPEDGLIEIKYRFEDERVERL